MATKHKKAHDFRKFGVEEIEATAKEWTHAAAKGLAFPADVEQVLDWVRTHTAAGNGDSTAYGVFPEGSKVASGICEVVVTRRTARSAWVKFLRLRLRPSLEDALFRKEVEAVREATEIFMTGVLGVFGLKVQHQANTLKIFGRTNEQLSFLAGLASALQQRAKGMSVMIEGRWLVCTNK